MSKTSSTCRYLSFYLTRRGIVNKDRFVRTYAMKSNIPIKWVRPEKIPCIHPAKSGDLKPLREIDTSQCPVEFRDSNELKDANELVKKLFSLKFFPYKKTVEALRAEYIDEVKRHAMDKNSPEVRLAKMTADIRDMQKHMEAFPTDKRTKVRLKETIDKRRRLLKHLREWDYKCYEWVLEKLDLFYKPYPEPDVYKRVERKRSLRMLTKQHCDDIVSTQLADYRKSLEGQQEKFLEDKIKTMQWIMKEEKECGVQATVSQDDVDRVVSQLEKLRLERVKPVTDVAES